MIRSRLSEEKITRTGQVKVVNPSIRFRNVGKIYKPSQFHKSLKAWTNDEPAMGAKSPLRLSARD